VAEITNKPHAHTGSHQLNVDLVEVDPDDTKSGTHPVTVECAVADQPARRPVTDLQVLGGLGDGDVMPPVQP